MGLSSLVGGFAEFVDVGNAGLNEWAFLEGCFGIVNDRCFEGLGVAFGVEELFAESGEFVMGVAFDFGEFGVDDVDRLSFSGDVGVLGLEVGDEVLEVGDRGFDFWIDRVIVFDVGVYLLEDLDFWALGNALSYLPAMIEPPGLHVVFDVLVILIGA
jgi:hypothetical protein